MSNGGFKARSADVSRFSMVPRADVPRSVFQAEQTHKTTFDAGLLIPVYVDEILPGDSVKLSMTAFCRLQTPIFPIMDNLHLDSFFFFVPNRLVWTNWRRFMGEQITPSSSTAFLVPQVESGVGGFPAEYPFWQYWGIPQGSQVAGAGVTRANALFFRAYNLIYNEWFRDQNLQNPADVVTSDSTETNAGGVLTRYVLRRRGKRHDYFTSALPWPMRETSLTSGDGFRFKGGIPVSGLGARTLVSPSNNVTVYPVGGGSETYTLSKDISSTAANQSIMLRTDTLGYPDVRIQINDMRQALAVQKLMERDARGGSRYTEIVRAHFGVISPDARLQRPEYLGGGSSPINVSAIAQTSATRFAGDTAGGNTPLGQLGGIGTGVATGHGFSSSFTEHGMIIGLVSVRADLTYQQGLHKMFTRRTKYDYYWPAFANLGEQAVLRNEIYHRGVDAEDNTVFGYQERWAEYRHKPNRISGKFRSYATGTLDAWHLSQNFTSAPVLGDTFIQDTPPMSRVLAAGVLANEQQVLFDSIFSVRHVRPIPAFSVPGLGDRF
jgi:hypothetical protein